MIYIFHGENITASRDAFIQEKKQHSSVLSFSGATLTLEQLTQALEGQGLFENDQPIFIEELLSKRKQSKELDSLVSFILNHTSSIINVWESKELTKKQLQAFKDAKIQKFDLPKVLFAFLDSLKPGNSNQSISLFHECLATEEPEFLFFMIVRQFRMLLALIEPMTNDQQPTAIDEVSRLAPWQKGKLEKQAKSFGTDRLLSVYKKLFEIESGLKTGQLSQPLDAELDLFLLSL